MTVVRFPVATPAADPTREVALGILGTIELHVAGQDHTPTAAKLRALLVTLALARGRRMTPEILIDELWTSPPRTARNVLHSYVSQLRRLLVGSAASLTYEDGSYRLVLPAGTFDVERFTTHAAEAEDVDRGPRRRARLEAALATWRGDPVPELRLGSRAEAELVELNELRTTLIERLAALEIADGQPDRAIARLRSIVSSEPLREQTWAQLIGALSAAGRWTEALLAYENVRGVLAEELGVEPSAPLRELHRRLLAQDGSVAERPGASRRRALPAAVPPPLLGRAADRRELDRSMAAHRLVCLTGPTGVGKTALALDAVHRHGSVLGVVEVADCRDRCDVLRALGDAVGLDLRNEPTTDGVLRAAADLSGLLVLDGCDAQLSTCAELVAALLQGAPRLRLLATTRQPLRLRGEWRLRIGPLEVPPAAASGQALRASPAVGLLIERARANGWRARLDPPTVVGLGHIARELDGLPLALELAAERLVDLSVDRLNDRLADRFQVLARGPRCVPERHRTLRAAVTENLALLDGSDQTLFAHLALFQGPFTAADVLAVVGAPDTSLAAVEDALARMVATSMLQPADPSSTSGPVVLSNTWRALATERLDELPDAWELRERHVSWVRERLTDADRAPTHAGRHHVLQLLDSDLTAACAQAAARGDGSSASALVEAAWWYWYLVGDLQRGLELLRATLALSEAVDSPAGARLPVRAAWFAHLLGDSTSARVDAGRAHAAFVRAGDRSGAGFARAVEALASIDSDPAAAVRSATQALELHRGVGDERAVAASAHVLGSVMVSTGDLQRAQALALESDRCATRANDAHGTSAAAQLRSDLAVRRGDLAEARRQLARGLDASIAAHHTLGVAAVVARMAGVVLAEGDPAAAAQALGAARALEWRTGCPLDPTVPEPLDNLETQLRSILGAADLTRLTAAGAEEPPPELVRGLLASGAQPRHPQPIVRDDHTAAAAGGSVS